MFINIFLSSFACPKAKGHHERRIQHALFAQAHAIGSVHVVFHTVRGQPTHGGFHSMIYANINECEGFHLRLICTEESIF